MGIPGWFNRRGIECYSTGMTNVDWKTVHGGLCQPLVWYKTTFDAPSSKHPLALNLGSMGKGEAWINGESIGRYWVSFKTIKGEPSQSMYHVPQSFLKPTQNVLVLFEEIGGNPLDINLNTMSVDKVCSKASDSDIPVSSFRLRCHEGKSISSIEFASYGSPLGDCGSYSFGSCHSFQSKSVVEKKNNSKVDAVVESTPSMPFFMIPKASIV